MERKKIMKPLKIGMISFAHGHAYSYAACVNRVGGAAVCAVADDDAARGRVAAARFGATYMDSRDALLRSDVDAVIVCSENARHKDDVIAAAQAGKHVLCEKPIATGMEEARAMIEACGRSGVKLQIAFPCRFNQPVRRVKQMVDKGLLGRILAMRGTNRGQNPGGWFTDRALSGGGAVLDHTVHVIDLMRWISKSEVREVYAEVDTRFYDGLGIDDSGLLLLEFENGLIASHDPSWSRCQSFPTWGDVTLQIVGEGGITNVDAFAQHLEVYSDAIGKMRHDPWSDDMDFGLVADFIGCLREDRAPSITGEDGLRAMQVALAAYESARTGQPVAL